MAESVDRKNAPEPLKTLARKLCGCDQNIQGGCPYPSETCLGRARVSLCEDCDNGQCTGGCLDNFPIGRYPKRKNPDDA